MQKVMDGIVGAWLALICVAIGIGLAITAPVGCLSEGGCISLEDSLAEHYCGRWDFDEGRVRVNGAVPPTFDRVLFAGDVVEVDLKYPLTRRDGSKRYITNRWTITERRS